jgi:hypothetical protein
VEPEWVSRGKTIRELIEELQTFENQDSEVRISLDGGDTHKVISLVGRIDGHAVLIHFESDSEKTTTSR